MLGCALNRHVPRGPPAPARDFDHPLAAEELPGQRAGHPRDFLRGPGRHHVAAVLTGSRSHVDEVIGGAHGALVVLDHQHRVPELSQPLERRDQLLVVALVKADRRLVEDVEHPDQRGPDLGREPDPLRFAARERRSCALHREVSNSHVLEELQTLLDLPQHQPGDSLIVLGQRKLAHPLQRPPCG